jgi:hypothetical protein
MPKRTPDWERLDPLIDRLREDQFNNTQIAKELGIPRQTLVDHLRSREPVHLSTPERTSITEVHQSTPEHPGTLEGHQEMIEDVQQSVPEIPHVGTPEHPSVLQQPDSPEEAHPSTPEVHPDMSLPYSSTEHSGVPARQAQGISTPMVHPGTPTEEDWLLWTAMKGRWTEIEKMLAHWQSRQNLLSTPSGTPRHTMKKTYVVDSVYVELIDRYAREQGFEIKDIVNLAFREFFERRHLSEGISHTTAL